MSFRGFVRDKRSKKALIRYIKRSPQQRLFQCITNFTKENIDSEIRSVFAGKDKGEWGEYEDTFFWECDEKIRD